MPITINSTYEIIEQIGQGGGGIVYKAYHKNLQKYVVLKQMKRGIFSAAECRNEVDLLKDLKHTYLPQVLDFIEYDGSVFTVMDYIDGSDLKKYQNGKPLRTKEIIRYAVQLCEAVKYLHSQKIPIIHSDIKPANIMITSDKNICLIDFNVSLLFDGSGVALGATPGFASPEQMSELNERIDSTKTTSEGLPSAHIGEETELLTEETELLTEETELLTDEETAAMKDKVQGAVSVKPRALSASKITVRSDIYSVGAVIYYMITGKAPDKDPSKIEPLNRKKFKVPEGLMVITEKAMSVNPSKRYNTADAMLSALRNVMKLDRRYRGLQAQQVIVTTVGFIGLVISASTVKYGYDKYLQERQDKYDSYIFSAEDAVRNGDLELAASFVQLAEDYMPDRPDAYYEEIRIRYEKGDYDGCVSYYKANERILTENAFYYKSDLFLVIANAYFEVEDYDTAILNYNRSLAIDPLRSDCYRDLAISYARGGRVDEAAEVIDDAIASGVANDEIDLMKGEIEVARENYAGSLEYFERVAEETENDYLLFRALLVYVKLCDRDDTGIADPHRRSLAILEKNIRRVSSEYSDYTYEMLANQYTYVGKEDNNEEYLKKAVEYYKRLIGNFTQKYIVYRNCYEIQFMLKDYEGCFSTLEKMESEFPNDYRTAMNYSYTIIEKQSDLPNEERDYRDAYQYYKKALGLYEKENKNGKTDPNLIMLGDYIDRLIEGNWIDP